MVETYELLGTKVAVTNLPAAAEQFRWWIGGRERVYVCFAPVSTVVDSRKDEGYRQVINGAGMVAPDGMPLVWIGKWKGRGEIARTYGPEFMPYFCEYGQASGARHFFYGGDDEVMPRLIERLKARCPRIEIAGYHVPPFRPAGFREDQRVLDRINAARPDVLWVGLGSPKQDIWMADHRPLLDVPVMAGVGAAFDFIAGKKAQAPAWMRKSGLEWLFRLCSEPGRLWKRYLFGNAQFLYFLITDSLMSRRAG